MAEVAGNHRKTPSSHSDHHRGWYSRGYPPHFDVAGLVQMITFRLADAMPVQRRAEWEALLRTGDAVKRRARVEAYLDRGFGACHLGDARIATVAEDALLHFDGVRYRLLAWVIMPNHVHTLVESSPDRALADVVHSWKSYTATQANRLLKRTGAFWQPEYHDRFIRDLDHFERAVVYIHENPVKAGLIEHARAWPFSSARLQ